MYYLCGNKTHWKIVQERNHSFYGTLKQVLSYSRSILEFKDSQIDEALDYMVWLKCDVAKFDKNKKFVCAYKSKECLIEEEGIRYGV